MKLSISKSQYISGTIFFLQMAILFSVPTFSHIRTLPESLLILLTFASFLTLELIGKALEGKLFRPIYRKLPTSWYIQQYLRFISREIPNILQIFSSVGIVLLLTRVTGNQAVAVGTGTWCVLSIYLTSKEYDFFEAAYSKENVATPHSAITISSPVMYFLLLLTLSQAVFQYIK